MDSTILSHTVYTHNRNFALQKPLLWLRFYCVRPLWTDLTVPFFYMSDSERFVPRFLMTVVRALEFLSEFTAGQHESCCAGVFKFLAPKVALVDNSFIKYTTYV